MSLNSDILSLAMDMAPDAIFFVKDHTRQYRIANMGLARVCGTSGTQDVVGRRSTDFFESGYVEWCDRLDHQIAAGMTLLRRFDHLYDHRGDPLWTLFSRAPVELYGEDLILGVSRKLPVTKTSERRYARLKLATEAISAGLGQPFDLKTLSEVCDCSVSQLERDFLRVLTVTPTAYRAEQRVQFVKDAISRGDALADIALEAGFSDQSTLSRFFRRETGQTMGAYRRRGRRLPR